MVSFSNKTKQKSPLKNSDLNEIKDAVLGKKYELSIVFVGCTKMKILNKKYRGKDKVTDILSFPIEKDSGEIIICPVESKKRAPQYNRNYKNYLYFLVIHGLHHLKGLEHGSRMEKEEEKIRKRFGI